jgi:hypothetical protein
MQRAFPSSRPPKMERALDYLKIAVIAYVGIYAINKGLGAVGLSAYKVGA